MYQADQLSQYKNQSLTTLTPGEVVVKLFEQASKHVRCAIIAMEDGDNTKTNESLFKAQQIFYSLITSLNMQFPVSEQLKPLYQFIIDELVKANIKKDKAVLTNVLPLIDDFRDTFRQADKLSRVKQ